MDREAKEEYFVVIQAKDMGGHMGGLSGTTTVTITLTDVNDNPPKFAQSKCHLYVQCIALKLLAEFIFSQKQCVLLLEGAKYFIFHIYWDLVCNAIVLTFYLLQNDL